MNRRTNGPALLNARLQFKSNTSMFNCYCIFSMLVFKLEPFATSMRCQVPFIERPSSFIPSLKCGTDHCPRTISKLREDYVLSSAVITEPPHDQTNKMTMRSAKTQISLGIRSVWSESSLCAQWVARDLSFLHADSEDSYQTGLMPRLI